MSETELVLGDKNRSACLKLVQQAVEHSGCKLSAYSEGHLAYLFQLVLKDKDVINVPVVHLYESAVNKTGTYKILDLERVGSISLMRAGFSFLVSRHFKKSIGNTTKYFTSYGKTCFYTAGMACEVSNREAVLFFQLVKEFELLVEVLTTIQNSYLKKV